jgi:hypothetical protein
MRVVRPQASGRFLLLSLIWVGFAVGGCVEPLSIHTAKNPTASFAQYRAFSFGPAEGPPRGYQVSSRAAELQSRLRPLIAAALTQRGYAASPKGDFFVMFGSGKRTVAIHEESAVGGEWLPDDENADFVEGSLVIDVFDGATGGRVWHGAGQAKIDPDHIDDALLQRTVAELVAAFPMAKS